MEEILGVRGRK